MSSNRIYFPKEGIYAVSARGRIDAVIANAAWGLFAEIRQFDAAGSAVITVPSGINCYPTSSARQSWLEYNGSAILKVLAGHSVGARGLIDGTTGGRVSNFSVTITRVN